MQKNKPKVVFIGLNFAHEFYLSRHKSVFAKDYDVVSIVVDRDPIIGRIFNRRSFFRLPAELIILFFYLLKERPKFVISVGPKVGLISSLASTLIPNCASIHWFTGQFWANARNKLLDKSYWIDFLISKLASGTMCDGPSQRDFIIRELSPRNKTISTEPGSINGIDQKFYSVPMRTPERNAFSICFVGRKAPGKGLDELLLLAYECRKRSMNVEFCIAGPVDESFDNYLKWKEEAVKRLDNVKFVDNLVSPEDVFVSSDALILLSEREGFSGIVIQAQASGRPVICSDIYGLKDTFIDDVTGYSVNARDISSQISAINKLQCSTTYTMMSVAAREFALQFAEHNFTSRLEKAYRDVGFRFSSRE